VENFDNLHERMMPMIPQIESMLYIDEQAAVPVSFCCRCGGAIYAPEGLCLRCGEETP